MTHRCVWDIPGTPFPAWVDFGTEEAAHLFALRKSRELGCEVAVVAVDEAGIGQNEPLRGSGRPNTAEVTTEPLARQNGAQGRTEGETR